RPPRSFVEGNPAVVRLIDGFREAEADYARRTGIFPIMHVVAIRRDVLTEHPWVTANLVQAFEEAKRNSLARVAESVVPHVPLPWAAVHAQEARELLGDDYWPYGIEANRTTLEAFLQYAHEQGIAARPMSCEELFPIEVQEEVNV